MFELLRFICSYNILSFTASDSLRLKAFTDTGTVYTTTIVTVHKFVYIYVYARVFPQSMELMLQLHSYLDRILRLLLPYVPTDTCCLQESR